MIYPFDETFELAPASGLYTLMGDVREVLHNSEEQALELGCGTDTGGLLLWTLPRSVNFWFEADVELLSDNTYYMRMSGNPPEPNPENFRYVKIYLFDDPAQGWKGYYPYHYSTYWGANVVRHNSYNYDVDNVSIPSQRESLSFDVGERRVMRVDCVSDPNVPRNKLIFLTVDGKVQFYIVDQSTLSNVGFKVALGCYNSQIRIHRISGGEPSILPVFPTVISNHGPDILNYRNPESNYWDGLGPSMVGRVENPTILSKRHQHYFSGPGSIVGTVKKKDTPDNVPLSRRVYLFEEKSMTIVQEVWSDVLGNYRFDSLDLNLHWTVIAYDYENDYRDVIANNLRAVVGV